MDEPKQSGSRVTVADAIALLALCLLDPEQLERGALSAVARLLNKSKPTVHRYFSRLRQAGYLEDAENGIHLALPEVVLLHFHDQLVSCTNPRKHEELTFQELTALQAANSRSDPTLLASCLHYTLSPPFRGEGESVCSSGGANKRISVRHDTLEIYTCTRGEVAGRSRADTHRMIKKESKRSEIKDHGSKTDRKTLANWPTTPRGRREATARVRRYLVAGGYGDLDAGIVASAAGFALRRHDVPQGLPDRYSEAVKWLLSNLGPESRQ